MKVAVVYDTDNLDDERNRMIEAVCEALSRVHDVEKIPFGDNFVEHVRSFEAVFNPSTSHLLMHVPAILDVLKIPYSGSSALAHALCTDKVITKIVLQHYGIHTPRFAIFQQGEEPASIDFFPAMVKPTRQGSAKGIDADSVVTDEQALKKAVKRVHAIFKEPALVEEFIDGREFSVGVLANHVLPILEIDFSTLPEGIERFYS